MNIYLQNPKACNEWDIPCFPDGSHMLDNPQYLWNGCILVGELLVFLLDWEMQYWANQERVV